MRPSSALRLCRVSTTVNVLRGRERVTFVVVVLRFRRTHGGTAKRCPPCRATPAVLMHARSLSLRVSHLAPPAECIHYVSSSSGDDGLGH